MSARPLDVAFLEPWYGGSHRAFLDAWTDRSRHRVRGVHLAPRQWKWRQEASAWELARRLAGDPPPDVIACSDYVDLPRLLGFLPETWRSRPTLCYFHENQLTYPGSDAERDLTHGFSNVLTAVRADALVFNSAFHLEDFRAAGDELLSRLPKPNPRAELAAALGGATVVPPLPELDAVPVGTGALDALRVVFPHRLEPDKDPVAFVNAVRDAARRGAAIEVVLLGGDAEAATTEIRAALGTIAPLVRESGFVASRADYLEVLGTCDVVASTARHEFFGVAFAEAMAAGCAPLALDGVNYPALIERYRGGIPAAGLAAGKDDLAVRLTSLAGATQALRSPEQRARARQAVLHLDAATAVRGLDAAIDRVHAGRNR